MSAGLSIVVEKDEDGAYFATVPQLPGVVDQGNNLIEVMQNICAAINFTLECMVEADEPIPEGLRFLLEKESA